MSDVEGLAEVLMEALCESPIWQDRHIGELEYHLCDVIAERILASPWLAARVQAARAEAAARLARVERLARDLLTIHSEIVMDTPEDRALHAEVVATFKAALDIEARAAALRADDAGGEGL